MRNSAPAIHPNKKDPIFGVSLFFDRDPRRHFRSVSRRDYVRYRPERIVTLNATYEASAAMQKQQVNRLMTPPVRYVDEYSRPQTAPGRLNRHYKSDEEKMRNYTEKKYTHRLKSDL
jgi:hypothetical protein